MSIDTGARADAPATDLYRAVWRWHFYAGLLVLPFLTLLAITGGLYLFREEIDHFVHADLMKVNTPVVQQANGQAQASVPLGEQVRAAVESLPGKAVRVVPPAASDLTTEVDIVAADGSGKQAVYVKEQLPDSEVTIYYIDRRAFGRNEELLARLAELKGVRLVKGKVGQVKAGDGGGRGQGLLGIAVLPHIKLEAVAYILAGLAGVVQGLGITHNIALGFQAGYGFDAIALALLGKSHPAGVVAASLLFGMLRAGAGRMQSVAGVPTEIVQIVQALVIIFIAAPEIIRIIFRLRKPKEEEVEVTIFSRGWGA